MTKIIVKNGDWDKARSKLGDALDANKARFNAQLEAAFAPTRKPADAEPAPTTSPAKLILSRSRGQ